MIQTQYGQFRDLDRRCLSRAYDQTECWEAIARKRALIEFSENNRIVQDVLAGKQTFVDAYRAHSRAFRGYRRFLPHRADPAWNQDLEELGRIIPNVNHFTRRGLFAADNPITSALYGGILAFALSILGTGLSGDDASWQEEALLAANDMQLSFTLLALIFGFLIGLFSMLKYRTRDPKRIHAREAATYMDGNYAFYRGNDDQAWARFMATGQRPTIPPPQSEKQLTS